MEGIGVAKKFSREWVDPRHGAPLLALAADPVMAHPVSLWSLMRAAATKELKFVFRT